MMRILYFLVLGVTLILTGCDKKKKEPILGEREAVFVGDDPLKADAPTKITTLDLPSPIKNKEWSMASGDPTHALDPVFLGKKVEKVWSRSIGRGSDSSARLLNGPVAAEGKVFTVDTEGFVTATDLKTGDKVWSIDSTPSLPGSQAFSGGLAYEDGHLFVVTPTAEIVMMAAADGKIEKRFELTAPVRAAPTIKAGHIYAVNINNQLEVIDYKTGQPVWSHAGIMEVAGLLGGASPAVTPDLIIVPYTSGEVYALHPASGVSLWSESLVSLTKLDPVSSLFHIKARPVVKGTYVYLIGNGGVTKCLEANSGKTVWSYKVGGIRTPAVSGSYLFMVSTNNELACFDRLTGKIYWVVELPRFENVQDKTGNILWAGPILANDTLIVAGSHGKALILKAQDGSLVQELSLGEKALLSPIIVDGTLLFLTDDGTLIAYR